MLSFDKIKEQKELSEQSYVIRSIQSCTGKDRACQSCHHEVLLAQNYRIHMSIPTFHTHLTFLTVHGIINSLPDFSVSLANGAL